LHYFLDLLVDDVVVDNT